MRYSKSWREFKKLTPETLIKRDVKRYLTLKGWYLITHLQGLGSQKGLADIQAIKGGEVYFLECKAKKGRQSDYQAIFQQAVESAGCKYLIVRSVEDLIEKGF